LRGSDQPVNFLDTGPVVVNSTDIWAHHGVFPGIFNFKSLITKVSLQHLPKNPNQSDRSNVNPSTFSPNKSFFKFSSVPSHSFSAVSCVTTLSSKCCCVPLIIDSTKYFLIFSFSTFPNHPFPPKINGLATNFSATPSILSTLL